MDPSLILASQSLRRNQGNPLTPEEVDAFYEHHGSDMFLTLSRWRARLRGLRQRVFRRRTRSAGFAPVAHGG